MNSTFLKMHGCGNDFLFIDAMDRSVPAFDRKAIPAICDRHFGIGADGLAIIERGKNSDAKWTFYNCDGSIAEMCGNAARCAVLFLSKRYFPQKEWVTLETAVGILRGRALGNGQVEVSLKVQGGTAIEYDEKVLKVDDMPLRVYSVNTGVPHAVIEVDDITKFPIQKVGNALVHHAAFGPAGSNITFFQRKEDGSILCTSFERGVETETYACGTGVAAGSIVYAQLYNQRFPVKVEVPGGRLEVDTSDDANAVVLRGPAAFVMESNWIGEDINSFEMRTLFGREN
ncbi:MAG: diaminopimelate epimerase [Bdellovibrionaceae bacterium]|nr:diaminopimelate epimerase [Bdellovibrionales bacterium]MCB9253152.1 diaminopimelate epimerase [Pseudobdellovibrionaceae bacterium]